MVLTAEAQQIRSAIYSEYSTLLNALLNASKFCFYLGRGICAVKMQVHIVA